jgi:drug/metabolite transporter (DMT)-like permease
VNPQKGIGKASLKCEPSIDRRFFGVTGGQDPGLGLLFMTANLLLLLTAAIWGFGFVAQVLGMNYLGPFAFIAARFFLGALSLLPVIGYLSRQAQEESSETPTDVQAVVVGSLVLGTILFAASSFQQVGLIYTTASNAGFITGMYMIFVPVIGLMLGVATRLVAWLGCLIACVGLFLLGVDESWSVAYGDWLQLAGALLWALHILAIDHFTKQAPGLLLAFGQFVVCATLAGLTSTGIVAETTTLDQLVLAIPTLIYAGVVTVGVAYTLQIIAQARAHPTSAGIILSLEAVFGAIGGYWLLNEVLTGRQLLGCALMLLGMVLSQLNFSKSSG